MQKAHIKLTKEAENVREESSEKKNKSATEQQASAETMGLRLRNN